MMSDRSRSFITPDPTRVRELNCLRRIPVTKMTCWKWRNAAFWLSKIVKYQTILVYGRNSKSFEKSSAVHKFDDAISEIL